MAPRKGPPAVAAERKLMSSYKYVNVNEFTPNMGQWVSVGNIASFTQSGNTINLQPQNGPPLLVSFLSRSMFRVRFNPAGDYAADNSYAVVNRNFGAVNLNVIDAGPRIEVDTGTIKVVINKSPYGVSVFRGAQLIHADTPDYNLVYIPGQAVVANFKVYPANARYYGFGEKAGTTLAKNQCTMTFFNFDNFSYVQGFLPSGETGGPLNATEPLYCSVPLLVETNPAPADGPRYSYGLFFDNTAQSYFNVGVDAFTNMFGKYYFGALYGDLDYYFIYGDEVPDIISQYTDLTGKPPMPPRHVFGYHQGCYGYYNRSILLQVANAYRAARIPIDGLHIDVDFQNNYRTFTSSELKFPQAKEMFDFLRLLGFKCSTNVTPLVTDNRLDENGQMVPYSVFDIGKAVGAAGAFIFNTRAGGGPDPDLYVGRVNYGINPGSNPFPSPPLQRNPDGSLPLRSDGNYPDFGRQDVRQWWGAQYDYLYNQLGVDMVWQDMTCPALQPMGDNPEHTFPLDLMVTHFGTFRPAAEVHNGYVINLLDATYNGLAALRPGRRNFIIARGGYAGMQRYAGLWTGDSASSWNFLRINIPEVLNLGMSGIPISGCDIGGFANGSPDDQSNGSTSEPYLSGGVGGKILGGVTNYELLTRWMQLGSFLPWYRNHYDGYTKQFQEPYNYGEPVPTNCRKYVELRYRMFHVYYSAMYEAHKTGMPIARALFLNDPHDDAVYDHSDDQFFVGRDFLVAPIVTQHETASPPTLPLRDVYLPAGSQWYAFKDNRAVLEAPVDGGTLIKNWYAPLDLVPIYVRAGAILPMRELEQYIGELPQNPITFNVYPGADSSYQLYQDDGLSTDYEQGRFRLTTISHTGIAGGQRIRVTRAADGYTPAEPFYFIALPGTRHPSSVTAAGAALSDVGGPPSLAASPVSAYYFNDSIQVTFVKVFDNSADVTVEVVF